jgi:hypothetical protein
MDQGKFPCIPLCFVLQYCSNFLKNKIPFSKAMKGTVAVSIQVTESRVLLKSGTCRYLRRSSLSCRAEIGVGSDGKRPLQCNGISFVTEAVPAEVFRMEDEEGWYHERRNLSSLT